MTQLQTTSDQLVYETGKSLADLEKQLPPASDFEIKRELTLLIAGMKVKAGDENDTRLLVEVYSRALSGKPLVAIRNAVSAYLRGEVPNADLVFLPACPELVLEVKRQFLRLIKIPDARKPASEQIAQGDHQPLTPDALERHEQVVGMVRASLSRVDGAAENVAGTGSNDWKQAAERSFKRFAPTWPTWVSDSESAARNEWMVLPEVARERAVELAPAYVEAAKKAGRKSICALSVYLRERRWERLTDEALQSTSPERQLRAYGKAWMSHRLWLLENLPAHEWKPPPIMARWVAEGREDLVGEPRRRGKHPHVARLDKDAEEGRGVMLREGTKAPDAEHFKQIARDSAQWTAWEQWHHARDWPWINPPKHVVWIHVPSEWPEGAIAERLEA